MGNSQSTITNFREKTLEPKDYYEIFKCRKVVNWMRDEIGTAKFEHNFQSAPTKSSEVKRQGEQHDDHCKYRDAGTV